MARVTDGLHGGGLQGGNTEANTTHLEAGTGGPVAVPSGDFIADADIARDGQDLILTAPNGDTVIIDGYFSADPAPMITAPDGSALTPGLVQSFVHGAGPLQYAEVAGMNDVSPVGAVHEVHGKATVTHPDGTTEPVALGAAIYQGDVIETEGDGAVEIGFIDESSFAVSSNARLAIDEFVFDPSSQGGESNFSMLRGMFVYTSGLIGREDPDDVKIGTPVGSIGIRGTTIAGNVDTGEITVVEGAIVLRAIGGGEVTLASQFGTAQFLPNGNVVQLPDASPADIGAKFASMNSVAPAFFSTISEAAQTQDDSDGGGTEDQPQQQQQEGNENTGESGTANPAPAEGNETQDGVSDPPTETMLMDDGVGNIFDESADEFSGSIDSFDGSSGSEAAILLSEPLSTTSESMPAPPAPTGIVSTASTATDTTTAPPPPPPVNTSAAIATGTLGVDENSTVSAVVGTVATANMTSPVFAETGNGTGAGFFDIDAAGNITVQGGTLDFESQPSYSYEVQATDAGGAVVTRLLTINLNNLDDETPTLNVNSARTLNEGASTIITTAFLDASDIDTSDANLTFTVTSGPANGQLELTTNPGVAIVSFTQADIIAGRVKYAHDGLETTSDSFDFDIDDGAGHIISGNTFSLTVLPVNDAPTLAADNTFAIDENSIGGAGVGAISTGADADLPGDTLTYSETGTGTGAGLFDIDSAGNITVTAGAYLDYENVSSYTYGVQISDGNGGTAAAMMTINVNDLTGETVTGNAGNNTLTGDAGDDTFIVNNADGNDTIAGGAQTTYDIYDAAAATGNMIVTLGAPGAGTAVNGANTDTFTGIERVISGSGNDTFAVTNANALIDFDAGTGIDTIDFSALGAGNYLVSAGLGGGITINGGSIGSIANFENIKGTLGADTITGNAANNTIWGMDGNDTIDGGGGNDVLNGSAGDDTIIVSDADGSDQVDGGGAGNDVYDASGVAAGLTFDLVLSGGWYHVTDSGSLDVDNVLNIEQFVGGIGTDTLDFTAATGAVDIDLSTGNVFNNGAGASFAVTNMEDISGGAYNDTLDGDSGMNVIDGGAGDDDISGGDGNDTLYGGAGNDTFHFGWNDGNDTVDGGADYDTYDASGATTAFIFDLTTGNVQDGINTDATTNIERFVGTAQDDTFMINSDIGLDIAGNGGTNDSLEFSGGIYDTANFFSIAGIEVFNALSASNNINLDFSASIFANDLGELTINLDGDDTLNIDFATFGGGGAFQLVSGNLMTGGTAQFLNSTTGNSLYINYAPGGTTITQTGAGGAGVLYLNTLGGADGFTIYDDIGEGFGSSLSFLGDIDGDGFDDLGMTKQVNAMDDGRVFMLSGQAGGYNDILVPGYYPAPGTIHSGLFNIGTSSVTDDMNIARIGDFNGDGIADYIVGTAMADTATGPTSTSGNAQIVDGASGTVIAELDGLSGMDMAGFSIAGIGDINHDGYADVIVGAPGSNTNAGSAFILFGDAYASGAMIDVTTLGQPVYAGDLGVSIFGADPLDVETFSGGPAGTVAFVLKNNSQLDVVNVDDPSAPFVHGVSPLDNASISGLAGYVGAGDPMTGVVDIKVAGNFLYILSGNVNSATQGQITVLDISDPVNPVFVDSYTNAALLNATAIDVDLVSGHLAVTAGGGGNNSFYLLAAQADGIISGPAVGDGGVIGSLGAMTPLAGSSEIILNGNFAYIVTANDPDGGGAALPGTLQVVDISTPSTPAIGSQIGIENIKNIYFDKTDNRLYAVSSTGGTGQVWVYDAGTPGNPSLLGSSTNNAFLAGATDIVVENGIAYVTTPGGVATVDVSNPVSVSMLAPLPDPNTTLNGSFALALDDDGFLHVVSGGASDTLSSIDTLPQGFAIDGSGAGDLLGKSVSGIGDFNGDGANDFMVSYMNGGAGEVAVVYGSPGMTGGINMANAVKFTGIVTDANNEVPLMRMGDLNGDGIADIGMFAAGANGGDGNLYIMFGGGYAAGSSQTAAGSADLIIWDTGVSLEAANGIGDFNGDGFDDMAVVMRSGSSADIYVVYGNDTLGGTYNMAMLNNAANAFHMNYTIPVGADPGNFDFTISSAGDLDGDGFSDLVIGLSDVDNDPMTDSDLVGGTDDDADGAALVVYGRDTGVSNATGSILAGGSGTAAANGDVVIGDFNNDILQDGGFTDISFRGGAGDDAINLNNGNFNDIDGGGGFDTLAIFSAGGLDFSSFSAEEMARVESIDLTGTGQLLQLTMRNIFDLMGSSDTGTLSITSSGGAANTLQIDDMGPGVQAGAGENQIATMLGADAPAADGGAYWAFTFGGYELQIDKTLVSNNNVDIV